MWWINSNNIYTTSTKATADEAWCPGQTTKTHVHVIQSVLHLTSSKWFPNTTRRVAKMTYPSHMKTFNPRAMKGNRSQDLLSWDLLVIHKSLKPVSENKNQGPWCLNKKWQLWHYPVQTGHDEELDWPLTLHPKVQDPGQTEKLSAIHADVMAKTSSVLPTVSWLPNISRISIGKKRLCKLQPEPRWRAFSWM